MAQDIQFHYFHGRGIGEPIRLLLAVGEIEFTDRRYSFDEYATMDELKAKLPFGQVPALEVDSVFIAQTDSLMRFAAKLSDLYPYDALRAARSAAARSGAERSGAKRSGAERSGAKQSAAERSGA